MRQILKAQVSFCIALLMMAGLAMAADTWTKVGSAVYTESPKVYFSAQPHTLVDSGYVNFIFQSKQYTGNMSFVLGFDTEAVKPASFDVYSPSNTTLSMSHTCEDKVVVDGKTNSFRCYTELAKLNNQTLKETHTNITTFEHSFDKQDGMAFTWTENKESHWKPIPTKSSNVAKFSYGGMSTWSYAPNLKIQAGGYYPVRAKIELPIQLAADDSKYWACIFPSSYGGDIERAKNEGQLNCLDPWWNTGWNARREINLTGVTRAIEDYPIRVNLTSICGARCRSDFNDIRITNSTVNFDLINDTGGQRGRQFVTFLVNATGNGRVAYVYYNKSTATKAEDNFTFMFETFEGLANNTELEVLRPKIYWYPGETTTAKSSDTDCVEGSRCAYSFASPARTDLNYSVRSSGQSKMWHGFMFKAPSTTIDHYYQVSEGPHDHEFYTVAGNPTNAKWGVYDGGSYTDTGYYYTANTWTGIVVKAFADNSNVSMNWTRIYANANGLASTKLRDALFESSASYWDYYIAMNRTFNLTEFVPTIVLGAQELYAAPPAGADSCTCPAHDSNWAINLSDHCNLTTACDIGTGAISYTETGYFNCNATITSKNLGEPKSGGTVYAHEDCYFKVDV